MQTDPNAINAGLASRLVNVRESRILVVGCNIGVDCKLFADLGSRDVHGLDVVEEIGQDNQNPYVTYRRRSIEDCKLPPAHFDLVYSYATMEHVPNVAAGYAEMARVPSVPLRDWR
jgi:2-polyprenyl-3-methyl-5-hydroxy-6-metoxy-1,4-benzoquinol methylase